MRVTTSFVRNLRKSYLQDDGTARLGCETIVTDLLTIHKALQGGSYHLAMQYGREHGLDLEAARAEFQAARMLGNMWQRVAEALQKHGGTVRFSNWEREPRLNVVTHRAPLVKCEADRPNYGH